MVRILMEPLSRALVVESPHPTLDDHLAKVGIKATRLDSVPNEATLIDELNRTRAQVLFKRSRVPVTRNLIESCPDLLVVQLCCIGDDSVDKVACAERGVLVFNDPVSNARSVVELVMAHLIALSRRLYETDVAMSENRWEKNATGRYEIRGKELGIVGLGNIGRQVARVAEAFGMGVRFYDTRHVAQEIGQEMGWTKCDSLEELFRGSDMVTVHTSAKDFRGRDNEGLLDNVLGQLGADLSSNSPRLFLNLARGNAHNTQPLLDAVLSGAIRRAAVDVYPSEPRPGQTDWRNPYADEFRVVCTPHIGAATQEAQPRIARRVAQTIADFSLVGAVRDCVYGPRAKLHLGDAVRGHTVLCVVHSDKRGTKKAVDDAIYEAGASNLGSTHRDFEIGVAYEACVIDKPLSEDALKSLVARAAELAGDPGAIRAIRQVSVS